MLQKDDNVKGPPCLAVIVEQWQNPHPETLIGAANESKDPAITVGSFLVCKFCGVIEPISSGQPVLEPPTVEPEEEMPPEEEAQQSESQKNASSAAEHYTPLDYDSEVSAQEYVESVGASFELTETQYRPGKTYGTATVTYHGKSTTISGEIKNGSLMIQPAILDKKFGWNSINPIQNTILKTPGIDRFAHWDEPYNDYTSSPFEGITLHSVIWAGQYGGTTINAYEGSKESMKAWADHMSELAGYYDFAGTISFNAGLIDIAGGTAIAKVIPTIVSSSAKFVNSSPWLFAGFLTADLQSTIYSNTQQFIIDQTYFQEGTCYFIGDMWITGMQGANQYDNEGNYVGHRGR